jgi:hypothetical protein
MIFGLSGPSPLAECDGRRPEISRTAKKLSLPGDRSEGRGGYLFRVGRGQSEITQPFRAMQSKQESAIKRRANQCLANYFFDLAGTASPNFLMVVSRPLVVCVNIGSLLFDVGLAIILIRKSAATYLTGFVCCVPAISNGSSIGFRFLNVT